MTKSLKLKIAVFTSIFLVTVFAVYFLVKNQESPAKSNNSSSSLASTNSQISSQISSNQNSSNSQNSQSQSSNSQNSTSSSSFASIKTNQQNSQVPSPQIIPKPVQNIQNKPISSAFSLPKDVIEIPIEVPKKSTTETIDEKCAGITNNSNLTNDAGPYYRCLEENGIEVTPALYLR